ncbi:hypothetical protein [Brucella sp. LJL56]
MEEFIELFDGFFEETIHLDTVAAKDTPLTSEKTPIRESGLMKGRNTNKKSNEISSLKPDFLINRGTDAIGIPAMQRKIDRGELIIHKINNNNISGFIEEISTERISSDYIFSVSNSKGIRILERPKFFSHLSHIEFHHQNIFQNDKDILTAGTLHVHNKKLIFTNMSGHYKPSVSSLNIIDDYMKSYRIPKSSYKLIDYTKTSQVTLRESFMGSMRNLFQCFQ